jgi:hypothetical protein
VGWGSTLPISAIRDPQLSDLMVCSKVGPPTASTAPSAPPSFLTSSEKDLLVTTWSAYLETATALAGLVTAITSAP